jgi:hypothetical protein
MWGTATYASVGTRIALVSELLCEAVDLQGEVVSRALPHAELHMGFTERGLHLLELSPTRPSTTGRSFNTIRPHEALDMRRPTEVYLTAAPNFEDPESEPPS